MIGIDLGTTNTAVAYIDTRTVLEGDLPQIVPFDLLQLVAEGKLEALPILPSFLYFLGEHERATASVRLPWEQSPAYVTGAFARDQGALVPGQLVASAKSWLCHDAVDRTAKILPWGVDQPQQSCSPVEASAHYLAHIREAWNEAIGKNDDDRFERQHIVLTVPASFDAEARELTVQAAHDAGIDQLTLLEEPQAAFYAWSHSHATTLKSELNDGDLVLICDVGGGTTDLSLIRVQMADDEITFERTAIGEHILLGGDNVDLALAHRLEAALGDAHLSLRQRQALRRQCCAAKEQLMRQPELEQLPIHLLGSGRSLVGGTLSMELTREDVTATLLDGFLPQTVWDDYPERERRVGLRELGLPYASEPAISKHLASFLTAAANAQTADQAALHDTDMMCPNAILFNGGFFTPPLVRERLLDTMTGWFREKGVHHELKVLQNAIPETAVAVGAAYYGHVRRSGGLRIHGGSARAYYMGVQTGHEQPDDMQAVCVLPRGTEEGTTLDLSSRAFTVLTNQPVTFTLYSSITRQDAHADVVTLRAEEVHRHAPLIAELRYGKKSRKVELPVQLSAHYSEVGTLEIWCESQITEHRWRLQFQLRAARADERPAAATSNTTQTKIAEPALQQAERQIRTVFHGPSKHSNGEPLAPEELFGQLESILGYDRDVWPVYAIRKLCDVLIESAEGRKKSAPFEARWLHMFGFCLRPGFSVELDDWRIKQARVIYHDGLVHPKNVDCQVQWAVLWRRIAGGLSAGQQHDLYQRHRAVLGLGSKKRGKRLNGHLEREIWRLLASLERLPAPDRVLLGQELLDKLKEQPKDKSYLWAIGRLGARIPFAGPLNCVIPAEVAAAWIEVLLKLPVFTPDAVSAIAQLGAKTDDPARDIEEAYRADILRKLESREPADHVLQSLREFIPPARLDAAKVFGESLPAGLRLVTAPE
jgi:molecular chaperone DnaK (HSP70)